MAKNSGDGDMAKKIVGDSYGYGINQSMLEKHVYKLMYMSMFTRHFANFAFQRVAYIDHSLFAITHRPQSQALLDVC